MNLREAYRLHGEDSEAGTLARQLLAQQHWFGSVAKFDPRTGEALPLGLNTVLVRVATLKETTILRDRLWRIVEHSTASIERLLGSLGEDPRREQAILPIRDVKEMDATSLIALSRRPGRNVREKLAGKPYMQAVRRYQSVDLPQNRLLKEFVTRLAELLEMRETYLGQRVEVLEVIHRWLRSDEARAISRWENLPPNNTLLAHRDYRHVWDAWRWIQSLDDDIDRDLEQLDARAATVDLWEDLGKAYSEGTTLFGDMPVIFTYDAFTIKPWDDMPTRESIDIISRIHDRVPVLTPACVDLAYVRPRYASMGDLRSRELAQAFVWQRWVNDRESIDLELFDSDAVFLHKDATTFTSADLFLARGNGGQLLQSAAHVFARELGRAFASPALVWLVPDTLNDFELQLVRRNINARFAHAEPLPRSIAAVFEHIDYSRITGSGFQAVIVDSFGGTTYATKLVTKHDSELEERIPETRGFYWERTPHVQLNDIDAPRGPANEIPFVVGRDEWFEAVPPQELSPIDVRILRAHPQVGDFDICFTLAGSPVVGGMRAHDLQILAGDIPIWRDQIPELSIKIIDSKDRYQPFYLVDRDTTIRPVRGIPVPIPVPDRFTLPAGLAYYQFPLFQGQDPGDLGYVARLESPSFPLAADAICRLSMTYTYGADDPYRLVFEPLDGSFKPVQVKWRRKTEDAVTDAPAPEYPTPQTWTEIQEECDAVTGRVTDFPHWAAVKTQELLDTLNGLADILQGTLKTEWKENEAGWHFAFAERQSGDDVYIHERALAGGAPYSTFANGDSVYFVLVRRGGRDTSKYVAHSSAELTAAASKEMADFVRRALYVPFIRTWSDGRSLSDPDCPPRFRDRMTSLLPRLESALHATETPRQVKNELRFLLSCTHQDMTESMSAEIASSLGGASADERSLGFALGDLSQTWQQDLLHDLVARNDGLTLRVFARAIWRNGNFVHAFTADTVSALANRALTAISEISTKTHLSRYEVSSLTRYCEFLLGLLRSRESENAETRMQLQPHQRITRQLADQIEIAADRIAAGAPPLQSRVAVANLPEKPEGDNTPDLLYALRLYLTGDVGANAIRVTGVNDSEGE